LESDIFLVVAGEKFHKTMLTGHDFRSWARQGWSWTILVLTAIIVISTFGIWRLFPIYPDEIFYRAFVSHAFFEGFERTSVWPFCGGPGQTVSVPYIFYPAATIFAGNSFIENLAYNRVIAITVMAGCFVLLWFSMKQLASNNRESGAVVSRNMLISAQMIFCSALLLCCLGVIPAALVMMRAEVGIYILVACLLLSFANFRASVSLSAVFAGFILLAFTVSLFEHPKALYYLPAVTVSIFALLWWRSRLLCLVMLACLAWAGISGYRIDKLQFLNCPEIPSFERYVRSFNIDPTNIFANPVSFVGDVLENVSPERFSTIAKKSMFVESYDVNHLPPVKENTFVDIANSMIGGCWIILAAVSIAAIGWYARRIFVQARLIHTETAYSRGEIIETLGMLALYVGFTVQVLLNKPAWFYDCSYWFCIMTFLAAPSLFRMLRTRLANGAFGTRSAVTGAFAFILLSASLSTVLSAQTFYQSFKSGFSGSSIVTMNSPGTKLSVRRALALCELSPTAPRLMVDDITYPFVQRSYKPISTSYAAFTTSLPEAVVRSKALGSSGMILGCQTAALFPSLAFKKDGGICCTNFAQ
jgi:hypothetical protein